MNDDERIARLIELARRVWPERESVEVRYHHCDDQGGPYVYVCFEHYEALLIEHPRALDALEAALLVLAGETPLVAAGQGAMCKLAEPAWVEQLAVEWEGYAAECALEAKHGGQGLYAEVQRERSTAFSQTAAELRKRAKGGG